MSTPEASSQRGSHRCGPRTVAAIALLVLGVCGAAIVAFPARPADLRALPNWNLAALLPGIDAFPATWNYSVHATLHRDDPEHRARLPVRHPPVFSPAECGPLPALSTLADEPSEPLTVRVDHPTGPFRHVAREASTEIDLNARYIVYPVADGAALITKYGDWLGRCGTYHLTAADPITGADSTRIVATTVGARSAPGADASLEVTRSTTITTTGSPQKTIYRVRYYWVRGVVLEYATNFSGPDLDVVDRVGAQALQKLRTA